MTPLHRPTQRRLKKIPQASGIWEGDRRPCLSASALPSRLPDEEYIIWADRSEGVVRRMDVVSPVMGLNAMVRTLLRAIETPMSPLFPARPQKILVRDREIQFFLRGVLQDLGIAVEYAPSLPLIDELFSNFTQDSYHRPPPLPSPYDQLLAQIATRVWHLAPWDIFGDHNVVTIQLNQWGTDSLYACVLGMLEQEYGILFYRSPESLTRFREAILQDTTETLEKAFLEQDCWFVTYVLTDTELAGPEGTDATELTPQIAFGSVHPYEGMRPYLDEEEALTLYVALQSYCYFVEDTEEQLQSDSFSFFQRDYTLELPRLNACGTHLNVSVSSSPGLETTLLGLQPEADFDNLADPSTLNPIQDDLIPENTLISFGMLPWEWQQEFSQHPQKYHQSQDIRATGIGFPVILLQTSRPKAKTLIANLQLAQGVTSICFTQGEDPLTQQIYDLGIFQMGNQELQLFGEFPLDSSHHRHIRQQWENRTQGTGGYCGLVIASGVTGLARGKPSLKDMMALFEAKAVSPDSLGLGLLELTSVSGRDFE